MKLEILYEDAYLLACVKPYGVLSQGDKGNDEDMITKIKHYLYDQEESEQAEEPYVAAIHRLDRPVGGVMVFAKTPEVAAKLSDMQQDGEIAKYYQAVITGELPDFEGEMVDYLLRDGKTNTTKVVKKGEKGAKRAELYYEVLDVMDTDDGTLSYVLIELVTGRHHQIRRSLRAGAVVSGVIRNITRNSRRQNVNINRSVYSPHGWNLHIPSPGKKS